MIYADTDFFIALAQEDDRLKESARKAYQKHKGDIFTNLTAILETAIVAWKKNGDIETWIGSIFEMAKVEGITLEEAMQAAHYIKEEEMNIYDAFHAVLSGDNPIISSDKKYDDIGKERIKLEQ